MILHFFPVQTTGEQIKPFYLLDLFKKAKARKQCQFTSIQIRFSFMGQLLGQLFQLNARCQTFILILANQI